MQAASHGEADSPAPPSTEDLFRTLVETSPDGIALVDLDGTILLANQRAAELYGANHADELIGLNVDDLLQPEHVQTIPSSRRDPPAPGTVRKMEYVVPTKDGGSYPAEIRVSAVRNADGQVVGLLSVIRDISERKRAEAVQRESEEYFRHTFHQAAIGIAHVSPEGRWLRVNPGICAMLGYSPGELLGQNFRETTHPDDVEANVAIFHRLISGEISSYVFEKRYIRKDGSVVWGNVTTSLVRDPSGDPQHTISIIEDITARKRLEERLRHRALHDALTNLPNRTLLYDRLGQAILAANRDNAPVALLLLDLDRFKEINDTFGHHCGDQLLQELACRLHAALRESDTIARLGGDEFAVLLPDTDEAGAARVAMKLCEVAAQPIELEGHLIDVVVSIGIAVYPRHGDDANILLRRADVAMYQAKHAGGGHALYKSDQDQYSPTRLSLISDLRHAIANGQLSLHYQPKVNLKTGRIQGVEALARWIHPQRGFIAPDQFIPLAEHTGLIRPLTLWVLDCALQQCRSWQEQGIDLAIAVNLSARNLHDPDLPEAIARSLRSSGVGGDHLVVELTESAVMGDPVRATEILSHLHEIGVRIAVDDFGTGYSSLAYLRRLPLDEIKIDKSFVLDMAESDEDCFIVRSVADLAHSLGLAVVAEGVENQQSLRLLAMMGCDLAQGYHLVRPLPASELSDVLGAVRMELTS